MVRRTRRFISPNLILCFSGWRNRHCLQRTVPSSHHRQGRPHRVCWAYGGTRQPSLEWRHAHYHTVVRHVAYDQVPIIAAHAGRRFQRTIPCMCPSFHCSASVCIAWSPPCFTAKLCRVASISAPSALCTTCSQSHRAAYLSAIPPVPCEPESLQRLHKRGTCFPPILHSLRTQHAITARQDPVCLSYRL